jgi:hypothetical protein
MHKKKKKKKFLDLEFLIVDSTRVYRNPIK